MVDPTNLKPRPIISLLIASDSTVRAGTCLSARHWLTRGRPPTKRQTYSLKLPNSFCTARNAFAQPIANDSLVREQSRDIASPELRHARRLESLKRAPIGLALAQYSVPAQPGL